VMNIDDELARSKKQADELYRELVDAGNKLTASRVSVFAPFKNELEKLLKELAMPYAKIDFRHKAIDPVENGMDKITILFSANAGITPDELKNVASGGEFSRLMFCIKYILAGKTALPTIVFDEIDTGISGEIALKMMIMMKQTATRHQMIAITHLPQIAAGGDAHYFVFKENENGRSLSKIKKLSSDERKSEIAKMIGGDQPSAAALVNAQELLSK
jgi:DNA repair protein RecN (Recombination protein N)